jgi:hypothetical protein
MFHIFGFFQVAVVPGDDFITTRICTKLSGFSRAAVYETLVVEDPT